MLTARTACDTGQLLYEEGELESRVPLRWNRFYWYFDGIGLFPSGWILVVEEKNLSVFTQRCVHHCCFFSSYTNSLIPPDWSYHVGCAWIFFSQYIFSLSCFLSTYPAVKLYCSLMLWLTVLQQGDLQHFTMSILYKNQFCILFCGLGWVGFFWFGSNFPFFLHLLTRFVVQK